MSNINKAAVLNPFSDLTANILNYVPRATTSEFGIVAIGSGINVDALGRIYLDTQEYSDRLAAIEAQAASSLDTQQTAVAAAIAQVNLTQSQTITALTLEVSNLKTNLTDSITATQTDLINRADQLAQDVTDITVQLTQDKAAFAQEIQDALDFLKDDASVASALRTPRKIQGVGFDGTKDISLPTFTTQTDGLVPKRVGATTTKYLREDGTWVVPPDTTYALLTAANAEAGTATSANSISAKVLKDAIKFHAPPATAITGNAGTATKLQTSRTISLTGKVTGSASFDGSANASITTAITGLGTANGIATLDSNGQVPSTQLPSYVDDVLEYANVAAFPATGEKGKIYVETTGNTTYRWSGTAYTKTTSGEVSSVAGKKGIVTLTKEDVGLSNVDNTNDLGKPISTATQTALVALENKAKRGIINLYATSLIYGLNERVVLNNGDIVKSTIDGNTNNPNSDMTGWVSANAASQIFDESGLSQQEINNNGFVLVDSRKLGLVGDIEDDQASAVAACNNYVNALPIHKDTPIVLRLPKGLVRSSMGFAFDRQTILFAEEDALFDHTGNGYAVRLGKLGEVDSAGEFRTFGIKGVSLTGGNNCTHGIYVSQYVLSPVIDNVKLVDFGNPNDSNSYCVFFQGHNWDIYIKNCKADWFTKNKVNLIRVNGVLTDGTPDYGNSRLNLIDNFYNQGFNASAGIGVYINAFKSRIIGGGFQGFKNSVQLGEYAQTVEVSGTYFETIYQDCESVFKIGEDGYTSEKTFSDLSLLNIYANLHNENNEFGNTNVKFLTTTNNVKLSNFKIDNIKTLNGIKYPLLNLQELSGQTCDVGNVSHGNALLHNIRDDQMVIINPKENHFPNSDLKVWQRGSTFSFVSGEKKLADGFKLIGDGSTGNINIYNEPILDSYNLPKDTHGMMRIVRTAVSTDSTYCTLRMRVGELDVLRGLPATFSFVAKSDVDLNLPVTLVRDYGAGDIEYIQFGSIDIKQSFSSNAYAISANIPPLNRSYSKGFKSISYIDISIPRDIAFVFDISCISLQEGLIKTGWESQSYVKDYELAQRYYQKGGYSSYINGQLKINIPLPRMRYTPAVTAHVTYQDAVVNYNATIGLADQGRFTAQLSASANDVVIDWTADAEL